MQVLLLFSVFVIATCGLVYELIAGALASYLLGDSVTQFSLIIGVYLFSMGIGSYLSRFVNRNLIHIFVNVEILIGLIGGFSAALLFLTFEFVSQFRVILYLLVFLTGMLVGLEIPILMRILKDRYVFKELVSKVFTFDYIGALIASILFPLILVPQLGLVKSAFLFGIFNVLIALITLIVYREVIGSAYALRGFAVTAMVSLVAGFIFSEQIIGLADQLSYKDNIVFSKSSVYQKIVLTKSDYDFKLYLNGNLQFSSMDEYRYHEALVHPLMASLQEPKNVLVLGGGDGLAVREVLKYPSVEKIVLIDLDSEMTRLFSHHSLLTELNERSLVSPKVSIFNQDAFIWLRANPMKFDAIIIDFPDPGNFSLGKLYTDTFYREIRKHLEPHGHFVVQSTSPYFAKRSFWIIDQTIKSVHFETSPYHLYVPSFGEWGFIIGTTGNYQTPEKFPDGLKYVNQRLVQQMFLFPEDMKVKTALVNKLNNQVLVRAFEEEWATYVH